ncbi:hypothetical protein CCR75_002812 [Bremia lactucae]|uniref:Elicitin n=1 Tax=Bremia lactucae TaxID=4779 RepID=A0A976FQS1_BRELC|nr:hypothetical protein CCR75_002812 [Bremia lactucae]
MKTAIVSAAALIVGASYSLASDCDVAKIESQLFPNATKGLANCGNATGINIFAVSQFPTLDQVTLLSENVDCANYLNQINQVANVEIQCNVTIDGVPINFGKLIASFLTGKTGNETDTDPSPTEVPSSSASKLMDSDSSPLPTSPRPNVSANAPSPVPAESSGASRNIAVSFISCGLVTMVIALS